VSGRQGLEVKEGWMGHIDAKVANLASPQKTVSNFAYTARPIVFPKCLFPIIKYDVVIGYRSSSLHCRAAGITLLITVETVLPRIAQ